MLYVAEAEKGIVLIPWVPEVTQVEIEVAVRVGTHVRDPTVAVGARGDKLKYDRSSIVTKKNTGLSLNFTPSLEVLASLANLSHRRIYFS